MNNSKLKPDWTLHVDSFGTEVLVWSLFTDFRVPANATVYDRPLIIKLVYSVVCDTSTHKCDVS
jgi:hypothetical protein